MGTCVLLGQAGATTTSEATDGATSPTLTTGFTFATPTECCLLAHGRGWWFLSHRATRVTRHARLHSTTRPSIISLTLASPQLPEALPASWVVPRGDPLSPITEGQTPKRFFAVSGGIVTPPESSIRKARSVENQPGRRLKLRQRHGPAGHTRLHCQSVNAPIWPASAATAAGYTINLGFTPGHLRGATGKTPSAQAERTRGRGGGGSGSASTATGYAIGRRWSASAVISGSYEINLDR